MTLLVDSAVLPRVALVGNPNVGKSTLFNRLTGGGARVGNYPGITVEIQRGSWRLASQGAASEVELLDLPGCYSLSAQAAEEQIVLQQLLGMNGTQAPQLLVVVVDASQLRRNLYLVLQLWELQVPLVVALTMLEEAAEPKPQANRLAEQLGVACVALQPLRDADFDGLAATVRAALQVPQEARTSLEYPLELMPTIEAVQKALPASWRTTPQGDRALALWALTSLQADDELLGMPEPLRQATIEQRHIAEQGGLDVTLAIVASRYRRIDTMLHAALSESSPSPEPARTSRSDRLDAWLLHPKLALPTFALVMLLVFQALFAWSAPAIDAIEALLRLLQRQAGALLPDGLFGELIVDGLIGGVGNVLVFLPQILLLFFLLGLLEDTGYMARVAVLMDRIMRAMGGLHGRAFVPMLSGYACAIPAILSTRTLERRRDRLLTTLVIPLMSCSARLPVYTLIIAALFPPMHWFGILPVQGLLMAAMYVFSTLTALLAAAVLGRTVVRGRRVPLVLELPPYRWPSLRVTTRRMVRQAGEFVRGAGSTILLFTLLMWAALAFPRATWEAPPPIEQSYAGRIGHALEPALRPLGFDWKIGIGIVGAFTAREVFVSTLGMVYGIADAGADDGTLRHRIRAESDAAGKPVYTPLMGLSLMVFFALACQCMSTLAVAGRETRSWRWPLFMFAYMTVLAWLASFCVYQGGRWLGFA